MPSPKEPVQYICSVDIDTQGTDTVPCSLCQWQQGKGCAIMYEMKHLYYRKGKDGLTDVYVFYEVREGWEVYYKRPGYPMMFAFGLSMGLPLDFVFVIADDNINEYEVLFK